MSYSADVVAGNDILATQYNNLRKDVLDTSGGHNHDGSGSRSLVLNTAIPAVTATPTEINQALDGISANVTYTNLNTLVAGPTSNADALHIHNDLVAGFNVGYSNKFDCYNYSPQNIASGFSDATTKLICAGLSAGSADLNYITLYCSNDIGAAIFSKENSSKAHSSVDDYFWGCIAIGSDVWEATTDSPSTEKIYKNGSTITFSGANHAGPLGHNPNLSYLLVLGDSTHIYRYSGISGTTLTYVDSITLDTAVSRSYNEADCAGFLFDATNNRYIFLDKVNNIIRRFNSSGVTIDTVSYTIEDSKVIGLAMINDRVYIVSQTYRDPNTSTGTPTLLDFIPTTMTR